MGYPEKDTGGVAQHPQPGRRGKERSAAGHGGQSHGLRPRHVAALCRSRRLLQRLRAAAGEQRKELLCLRGVKDPLRLFFCIFLLHK